MNDSEDKTETESRNFYDDLTNGEVSEEEDRYSEERSFGNGKVVKEKKSKNKREKGPPIVCLMCKTMWTKSRRGGRLFMFGGTRPFMAKFEAKFKALMGQEDLSALQKNSATKFGRSYICRECYLTVRLTYDNIRRLQRDVCKSIQKVKSVKGCQFPPGGELDSGSDQDLQIDLHALNIPKKKLPPVAERMAEKIANLTLVKINFKVPVILMRMVDIKAGDGHCEPGAEKSVTHNQDPQETNKCQDTQTPKNQNNDFINQKDICNRQNGAINESVVTPPEISFSCSKEAAESSQISLNVETSFASQHLVNNNQPVPTCPVAGSNVEHSQVSQKERAPKHAESNDTDSLDSHGKHKPSCEELAEILANPLLLIKSPQPIKLVEVKNNNVYICGQDGCDWLFSSKFFWENHIRHYHRSGRPFICPFAGCQRSFTGKSKLELHVRSHTDERPFICDKCGSSFRGNQELRAHRLTHTSEKPHQCPKCDKNFKLLSSLKRHLKFHDGGDFPYPCTYPECEKAFKSKYDLKCHYRLHTGEKPYKCPEPGCGMAFRIPCQFTMHKRTHTGEKPFRCSEDGCSAAYISSNALQAHMLSHTSERPFCCEFCGKTFKHKMLYRMHLKKHSGAQDLQCPVQGCGEESSDRRTMDQHVLTNHGILNYKQQNRKVFLCPEEGCGSKYSTDGGLQYHTLKVHKKDNIECKGEVGSSKLMCPYDKCRKVYGDSTNLQDHLTKAHIPMPREKMCPLCGQAFPHMEQLEQHMSSFHQENSPLNQQMEAIFVCNSERCGVRFRRQEDLKHHVTWHLGNPPYRCELEGCGRTFLLEARLSTHTLEHPNNKHYTCSFDHCHEGFTSLIKVLKHSKTHYGFFRCPIDGCSKAMQTLGGARMHLLNHEKPYLCFLCGKQFSNSSQWIKHNRSHTGERVYECKVCSCQFASSEGLKSHKQTHKGETHCMCEECGHTFGSHLSYKNHMKTHAKELPFVCSEGGCGKKFSESSYLKAHMNVHSKPSHLCTQCGKVYKFSVSKHKCQLDIQEQVSANYQQHSGQHMEPVQSYPSSLPATSSAAQPSPSQTPTIPLPLPQALTQTIVHTVPQTVVPSVPQTVVPSVPQTVVHSVPQTVVHSISQNITQHISQPLTHSLPQQPQPHPLPHSTSQPVQHPSSHQYINNVMTSELPGQSFVMEVEEAARVMRQNFGAPDTIVVDSPYYNYIILYDRPVQQ